jgi:hypothetical protein
VRPSYVEEGLPLSLAEVRLHNLEVLFEVGSQVQPLPFHFLPPNPVAHQTPTHNHTRVLYGLSAQTGKREPTTPRMLPVGSIKPPPHTGGPGCGRMTLRPRGVRRPCF